MVEGIYQFWGHCLSVHGSLSEGIDAYLGLWGNKLPIALHCCPMSVYQRTGSLKLFVFLLEGAKVLS